jgi:hypothetical protein
MMCGLRAFAVVFVPKMLDNLFSSSDETKG